MNSIWGTNSSYPFAIIEFFGQNGAYAQFPLLGNYNIRDWNGATNVPFFQKKKICFSSFENQKNEKK